MPTTYDPSLSIFRASGRAFPAGGLKINSGPAGSDVAANKKPAQISVAPPGIKSSLSDAAKFANEFSLRARRAAGEDKQAADLLTDGFLALAKEIAAKLGQDEADKFQEAVLRATDNSFRLGDLVGAVGGFFSESQEKARAGTDVDLFGKLIGLRQFINEGLDIAIDEENILAARLADGETPGAAYALNKFFKTPFNVAGDMESVETSGFGEDFQWTEMRAFKRDELTDGPFGPGYYCYINTGQGVGAEELIGSEALRSAADFLAGETGNNNAASLLNNLAAGSNAMKALNMTVAIVARENGAAKAGEYVSFLNANLKDAINSTLKDVQLEGWLFSSPGQAAPAGAKFGDGPLGLSGGSGVTNQGYEALETSWRNANGVGVLPPAMNLHGLYLDYLNRP